MDFARAASPAPPVERGGAPAAKGRLHARLVAAGHALRMSQGAEKALVSTAQSLAVIQLAKEAALPSWSAEDRAKLTDTILSLPWIGKDRSLIIAEMMNSTTAGVTTPTETKKPVKVRRLQQRYCPSVLSYFTIDEWALLTSPAINCKLKMEVIFARLSALGARNLSEPCKKYLGAVALLISYGVNALAAPYEHRMVVQRDTKTAWEKWSRRHGSNPEDYMMVLDSNPATLERERPRLFAGVFEQAKPDICRFDLKVLACIDNSMHCRNVVHMSPLAALTCGPIHASAHGAASPHLETLTTPAVPATASHQISPRSLRSLLGSSSSLSRLQSLESLSDSQRTAPLTDHESPRGAQHGIAEPPFEAPPIAPQTLALGNVAPRLALVDAVPPSPAQEAAPAPGPALPPAPAPEPALPPAQEAAPPQPSAPIAAAMLGDFLSMTKGRSSLKRELEQKLPADEGSNAGVAGADASASQRPRTDAGGTAIVKIEHEATRCSYRVRVVKAGTKQKSSALKYSPSDSASKANALKAAEALAAKWRQEL